MGPLPDFRVPSGRLEPFSTTSLDAAGPFETKQGRGKIRTKRYLLIFTCTVTRAVHIEVMYGLSAESFILALSRFASERSRPEKIVCDNAGQFVKGAELLKTKEEFNIISNRFPDIEFQFIPARSPHVNGITERMVRSMKISMRHVLTDGLLVDDELWTLAKQAQFILNSRPLSYRSVDDDIRPLTPAHFLADKALKNIYIDEDKLTFTSRYRLLQNTLKDVWKRFQAEAIPRLNMVTKWLKDCDNLEVGDVVVVLDAQEAGLFPLGRVVEVFPGKDGRVRIVKVTVRGHITTRHSSRLMLLLKEPKSEST
jgi:hypothetical protein